MSDLCTITFDSKVIRGLNKIFIGGFDFPTQIATVTIFSLFILVFG